MAKLVGVDCNHADLEILCELKQPAGWMQLSLKKNKKHINQFFQALINFAE